MNGLENQQKNKDQRSATETSWCIAAEEQQQLWFVHLRSDFGLYFGVLTFWIIFWCKTPLDLIQATVSNQNHLCCHRPFLLPRESDTRQHTQGAKWSFPSSDWIIPAVRRTCKLSINSVGFEDSFNHLNSSCHCTCCTGGYIVHVLKRSADIYLIEINTFSNKMSFIVQHMKGKMCQTR